MKTAVKKPEKFLSPLIDYFFWVLLILYTNPGGIVEAFNASEIVAKIDINDFVFLLLTICFIIIPKNENATDSDFKTVKVCLLIFLIYYFIFHTLFVPLLNGYYSYSLLNSLVKSRHNLYYFLIFIYIYYFFKRRDDIFIKLFVYSSAIILFLFLFQLLTGIHYLPIFSLNRGFIDIDRALMTSEGIISLIVPVGIVLLIFKPKIDYKKIIIAGFTLFPIYTIVSLRRKEMLSIVIYLLFSFLLYTYLTGYLKRLLTGVPKLLIFIFVLLCGSYFLFPKYTTAAGTSLVEAYNIIQYGRTSTGVRDERLGLSRAFIVNQFQMYPVFGTGFDNRWRNDIGQKQGFESSDYPLLAAFARFGIIGVLLFIPVYIVLIKLLKKDIQYLKRNKLNINHLSFLLLLSFILFFIFHMFQYFNWFCAIASNAFYYWYFFLALYLASRTRFYQLQNQKI